MTLQDSRYSLGPMRRDQRIVERVQPKPVKGHRIRIHVLHQVPHHVLSPCVCGHVQERASLQIPALHINHVVVAPVTAAAPVATVATVAATVATAVAAAVTIVAIVAVVAVVVVVATAYTHIEHRINIGRRGGGGRGRKKTPLAARRCSCPRAVAGAR